MVTEGLGAAPDIVIPDLPRHLPRAANLGRPALMDSAALRRALAPLSQEVGGTRTARSKSRLLPRPSSGEARMTHVRTPHRTAAARPPSRSTAEAAAARARAARPVPARAASRTPRPEPEVKVAERQRMLAQAAHAR